MPTLDELDTLIVEKASDVSCFAREVAENISPPKDESEEKPFPDTTEVFESAATGWKDNEAEVGDLGGTAETGADGVCGLGVIAGGGPHCRVPNPSWFAEGVAPLIVPCEIPATEAPLVLLPSQSADRFGIFELGR